MVRGGGVGRGSLHLPILLRVTVVHGGFLVAAMQVLLAAGGLLAHLSTDRGNEAVLLPAVPLLIDALRSPVCDASIARWVTRSAQLLHSRESHGRHHTPYYPRAQAHIYTNYLGIRFIL